VDKVQASTSKQSRVRRRAEHKTNDYIINFALAFASKANRRCASRVRSAAGLGIGYQVPQIRFEYNTATTVPNPGLESDIACMALA
jgi:hypothetical protein